MPDPDDHESASTKGGDDHEKKAPKGEDAIDGDLLETSWDDDDEDDAAFAKAFGGKGGGGSRTVWVVGAAVLVVVVLVGALILGGKNNKKSAANPPTTSADSGGANTTTPTTARKGHVSARWPSVAFGRPASFGKIGDGVDKVKAGAKPGVYVWDDYDGWHLWIVRGPGADKVKGSISSSAVVTKATALGAPASSVTKTGKVVSFDFTSVSAPVIGVNLNPGFYATALIFIVDGPNGPLDPKLLFQGQGANPIPKSPFAIEMAKPA